jgi:hypothetical protein
MEGASGRRYWAQDRSAWAEWEALHDAGVIPTQVLAAATRRSEVPDEVAFLGEEEVAALGERPAVVAGSAPVPVEYLDYGANHLPADPDPAWHDDGRPDP